MAISAPPRAGRMQSPDEIQRSEGRIGWEARHMGQARDARKASVEPGENAGERT